MNLLDLNKQEFSVVSAPDKITELMNKNALLQGVKDNYYLYSIGLDKAIISNVPSAIYSKLKPVEYIAPTKISSNLQSIVLSLQESINILHNNPDAADRFSNGKVFQLNQCHHNSTGIFRLVHHLKNIKILKLKKPIHIVLGYIVRKIPSGVQVENYIIENNSIRVHEWHIWNYVENILVDMSMFTHGGLLPYGEQITSWGTAQDHVFIYPPKGLEYWGTAYNNYDQFTKNFSQFVGFEQ